jgi:hypothetical protein
MLQNCSCGSCSTISNSVYGFYSCTNLSSCYTDGNIVTISGTSVGFDACIGVVCCTSSNNSGTSNGWGYNSCYRCYGNTGTGNFSALFNACYFSSDVSVATAVGNGNA